jgi:tetratricopeptide (TPR) repeat protein
MCIKGILLDVAPEYSREAENALTKAVKLNPSLVEAWNTLGHCYWKKGDLPAAKNCFNGALKRVCGLLRLDCVAAACGAERERADGESGEKALAAAWRDMESAREIEERALVQCVVRREP